jgi:YegS/Rv2252/BmrU family lipid kinase
MAKKAVLFYNPLAGHSKEDRQCKLIKEHFANHDIDLQTVFVPKPYADLKAMIDSAVSDGAELFIAAGGDGTVSMIGTHLVGKDLPFGIIPLGTGNLLSKALHIPQKLEDALNLVTQNDNDLIKIDTIKSGDRYYTMNISIGLSPQIMESVDSEKKRKLGFFAYLIRFGRQIFGLKLHRVYIEYDQKKTSYLASEILVTNIGTAGREPLKWSEDISLCDGSLDLLVFRTAKVGNLFRLFISVFTKQCRVNPEVKFFKVYDYCRVDSQTTLITQADGDIIGETPFEVRVIPSSLTIIAGKDQIITHKNGGTHEKL